MLNNKRTKHSTPAAGVASGLSSSEKITDKKLRGEGDGQIPHSKKSSHTTKAGKFEVC